MTPPCGSLEVLQCLVANGLPDYVVQSAIEQAAYHGQSPGAYMIQQALVTEEAYYYAVAEYCQVDYLPGASFRPVVVNGVVITFGPPDAGPILISVEGRAPRYVLAPSEVSVPAVKALLDRHRGWAECISIVSPSSLREALALRSTPSGDLEARFPEFSARSRFSYMQRLCFVVTFVSLLLAGFAPASVVFTLFSIIVGLSSIVSGVARCISAWRSSRLPRIERDWETFLPPDEDLPVYTVLVPLYHEAQVVPDLIAALQEMDYPPEKLDIKFLVERDDFETREAFRRKLPPQMSAVLVPDGEPKTKPRALAYGLACARGQFLTIYDAEDRPEPTQLRKAVAAFAEGPRELACLQARLTIDNANESFFARQFALEYGALFDQIIPWFSDQRWPFPLGGTSNHFRRSALDAVGGWDPYNVTEDADLGVRLARFGFTSGALDSYTREEAPVEWKAWVKQRSRWYKGWLQTTFVHMRDPAQLWHELGPRKILPIGWMVIGSLLTLAVHPVFFMILLGYAVGIWHLPLGEGFPTDLLLVFSCVSMIIGYGGNAFALRHAAYFSGLDPGVLDSLGMPFYWLHCSVAFYLASWDFVVRPHHWRKTQHGVSRDRVSVAGRGGEPVVMG